MAYNPGDKFVTPTGIKFYDAMFGEGANGGNTWFGADPFTDFRRAYDFQRNGLGVLDAPDALKQGLAESGQRYNNWSDRWNQWNNTDVTGPDGQVLLSPVHQTGLRVGQDYGVRNDDGSVSDPWHSQMFQAGLGIRNNLNQDQWLDPTNTVNGMRSLNASSPYGMPNPNDYLSTMQRAQGGPGQADFYGQRGLQQTQNLDEVNQRQLARGIDREAQMTLANQLPETMQAFEAAGLGRSGAGQMALMQNQNQILEQANRDKQRTMADYTDRSANRQASAINLGSQLGAQGYENYAGRQGQAALAGLGDQFNANQANRQNEQALWSQQMQNRYSKNQGDQNALFQLLGQSGQYTLGGLDAERMGQSQALNDWLNLQSNRNQTQANSLQQYLQLAMQNRSIDQDRVNQMLSTSMMPFDTMLRIMTGTTAPSQSRYGQTNPWMGALASAGGDALGSAASGAITNWWNGPKGGE